MLKNKNRTIKDVANRANVSISTVSRVLNQLDRVSPKTKSKIKKAIRELNYVKNPVATAMITGYTNIILVLVPDFINHFFSSVIQGIEYYLKQNGFSAMVYSTGENGDIDYNLLRLKLNAFIDGLIIIPSSDHFFQNFEYKKWNKPCVIADRYIPGSGFNAVVVDNFGGIYKLCSILISANHTKIAIIAGSTRLCVGLGRLDGYKQALRDHSIQIRDEYIRRGALYQSTGYSQTKELLSLTDPPTAIIAGNNLICEGCMLALDDLDLKIGEDISLVGFDDHILARVAKPGITVVESPTIKMGELAAQRLLDLLEGKDFSKNREVTLDVSLIQRNSVKLL
jgi:DNA-binding LacI/PurR family transcriptional regulator